MGPAHPAAAQWVYISGSRTPDPPRDTAADVAPPPAQGGHAPLPGRVHTRRGARFLYLVAVHRASGGQCRVTGQCSWVKRHGGSVLLSRPVVTR